MSTFVHVYYLSVRQIGVHFLTEKKERGARFNLTDKHVPCRTMTFVICQPILGPIIRYLPAFPDPNSPKQLLTLPPLPDSSLPDCTPPRLRGDQEGVRATSLKLGESQEGVGGGRKRRVPNFGEVGEGGPEVGEIRMSGVNLWPHVLPFVRQGQTWERKGVMGVGPKKTKQGVSIIQFLLCNFHNHGHSGIVQS